MEYVKIKIMFNKFDISRQDMGKICVISILKIISLSNTNLYHIVTESIEN